MTWFRREKTELNPADKAESRLRTEGLWSKCDQCRNIIWKKDLEENQHVCPRCGSHFRLGARPRLALLFDESGYQELDAGLFSTDPLSFTDTKAYRHRLASARSATGLQDAVITAEGRLDGQPVIVCAMEYGFIGGSMGAVVGEKITRAVEYAENRRQPLIVISASGGARMMEGAVSLMQMGKIAAALARLDEAGVPFISILTDPTTGGVTASYAMLGDLNLAEPGALIGFAGPRVIEQTIRQKLPEGFQRSEFLREHGMLDAIVERKQMRATLIRLLAFCRPRAEAAPRPRAAGRS